MIKSLHEKLWVLAVGAAIGLGGSGSQAETALTWPEAGRSIGSLVAYFDNWLDEEGTYPPRETAPAIRAVWPFQVGEMGLHANFSDGHIRGLYRAADETIYLVMPWSAQNPSDASTLLHEMIHHRQAGMNHWQCEAAHEGPAYRLQDAWLREQGLVADVNWVAVLLASSCAPRDIHAP